MLTVLKKSVTVSPFNISYGEIKEFLDNSEMVGNGEYKESYLSKEHKII